MIKELNIGLYLKYILRVQGNGMTYKDELGEDTVEYINLLLEVLQGHQRFLRYKGIDRQEFEDYLNLNPYNHRIH